MISLATLSMYVSTWWRVHATAAHPFQTMAGHVMLAYVHVSHSCTPLVMSERKHVRYKVNNILTVVLCSASPSLNFGRHCVRCKLAADRVLV